MIDMTLLLVYDFVASDFERLFIGSRLTIHHPADHFTDRKDCEQVSCTAQFTAID
jgi:hypothetical protein